MKLSQLKGIDPVFTKFAQGYVPGGVFVGDFIAPPVTVPVRSGQIITFGKDQLVIESTLREPGGAIKRYKPSYSFKSFSLKQDALGAIVPYEWISESSAAGIQGLQAAALKQVLYKIRLGKEKETLNMALDATQYEASLTDTVSNKWDAESTTILKDVLNAKEAVRAQCGEYPNSMVISSKVYNALISSPEIMEHYTPTSSTMLNQDILAQYLNLSRGLRVSSKVEMLDGVMTDLMDEEAILFYAPPGLPSGTLGSAGNPFDRIEASFMYNYVLNGSPMVRPWYLEENSQSYVANVLYDNQTVGTGIGHTGKLGAGYLFTNLLS